MPQPNGGHFKPGPENPIWKGGRHVHVKGYLRYSAGERRNKYVHRCIIEDLLGHPISASQSVEHLDHNRQHNCISNLMLLEKAIHDHISLRTAGLRAGDFGPYELAFKDSQ